MTDFILPEGYGRIVYPEELLAARIKELEARLVTIERETVERIVAWLTCGVMFAAADYEIAKAIEAGDWKQ